MKRTLSTYTFMEVNTFYDPCHRNKQKHNFYNHSYAELSYVAYETSSLE